LLLTAVAATTDALSYLRLDVFPANMTGNTVLIAIDIATHRWHDATLSGAALGGFLCGAGTGGAASAYAPKRRFLVVSFLVEACLLGIGIALWQVMGGGPQRWILVAALGAAMGLQSATVTQLHVGVSTTYITGTWTAVSTFTARRMNGVRASDDDERQRHRLQAAVVVCYFAAALVAAFAHQHWT